MNQILLSTQEAGYGSRNCACQHPPTSPGDGNAQGSGIGQTDPTRSGQCR